MTLKLSAEGLRSLERELDSLEQQLRDNRIYKNKIAVENGNVWHDNNDFEQCEIEERRLMKEISDMREKIFSAEIISSNTSLFFLNYEIYFSNNYFFSISAII